MNLEMEGREEQDRELVRAAACRLTLSLMALYKLFNAMAEKAQFAKSATPFDPPNKSAMILGERAS